MEKENLIESKHPGLLILNVTIDRNGFCSKNRSIVCEVDRKYIAIVGIGNGCKENNEE